jgi:hypothetical protein
VSGPGQEEAVASVLEERTGRHCLFVPWGRLALYLTLRIWLSPGDRIPMSPGRRRHPVRRAGRRAPVMAPVSANAGERGNELAKLSGRPVAWESCLC